MDSRATLEVKKRFLEPLSHSRGEGKDLCHPESEGERSKKAFLLLRNGGG